MEVEMTKKDWEQLFEYLRAANTLFAYLRTDAGVTWSDAPPAAQFVEAGSNVPLELWLKLGLHIGEKTK